MKPQVNRLAAIYSLISCTSQFEIAARFGTSEMSLRSWNNSLEDLQKSYLYEYQKCYRRDSFMMLSEILFKLSLQFLCTESLRKETINDCRISVHILGIMLEKNNIVYQRYDYSD